MSTAELKGSKDGVRLVVVPSTDLEFILYEIEEKMDRAASFLGQADLVVEVHDEGLSSKLIGGLLAIMEKYPSITVNAVVCTGKAAPPPAAVGESRRRFKLPGSISHVLPRGISAVKAAQAKMDGETLFPQADVDQQRTVICQTLRSGKRITCRGDLVILGNVNPGAEVRATGNVFVLGALMGLAHAGWGSTGPAMIYANQLAPLQLRIGDRVAVRPENEKAGGQDRPEVAYVDGKDIVVQGWREIVEGGRIKEFFHGQ